VALDIVPEMLINGQSIPVADFEVTSGAYGSVGHLVASTSRLAVAAAGINLIGLAANAASGMPVDIYVTLDGTRTHIFSGEYVTGTWEFDQDLIEIHARDWAGPLVDQKRILSSIAGGIQTVAQQAGKGVETQNQTLSQIVSAIAQQFSLIPDLRLQKTENPTMGTLFGSDDTVYWASPYSLWAILNKLARDTGNEVYVTPDKHLVFGTPGAGLTPITLSYHYDPPPAGTYPCYGLKIEHNPRRNLTFQVMVLSYDPGKAQTTQGQAVVMGTNVNASDTVTVHAGAWSGADATAISSALGNSLNSNNMPVYTIRIDGLTQTQAQNMAVAIANDIAKRELILTAETDGIPAVAPLNPMTLVSDIVEPEFLGHQFWINKYTHTLRMGGGKNKRADFRTTITALDLQLEGVGDAITTGTGTTRVTPPVGLGTSTSSTSNPLPTNFIPGT
jgi:hypothetical protein